MAAQFYAEPLENLIGILQRYGFTRIQAEIFIHLTKFGPSSVGTLAKALKTNRMNVFRNIKKMESIGLVEATLGRPIKYAAVPIDKALNTIISAAKNVVSEMEGRFPAVIEAFSKVLQQQPSEQSFYVRFRVHSGRRNIYTVMARMLENSRREVLLLTTPNDLICLSFFGLEDILKGCRGRGVEVKILTNVADEKIANLLMGYIKDAVVRHADFQIKTRMLIVDERETLTSLMVEDSMDLESQADSGFWNDSPQYAQSLKTFFDLIWNHSSDLPVLLQYLSAGSMPEKTVTFNDPNEYVRHFMQMIGRAGGEVLIIANTLGDIPMLEDFIRFAERAKSRGVNVRVITCLGEDFSGDNEIFSVAEVRHSDIKCNFDMVVVDRKENLLRFPFTFEEAGVSLTQCLWSNNATFSQFLSEVFMELWAKAVDSSIRLMELKFRRAVKELPKVLKPLAEGHGWILEMPAKMEGASKLKHIFDLALKYNGSPSQVVVGDVFTGAGDIKLASIAIHIKAQDVKASRKFILSPKVDWLGAEDRDLIKSYGIDLIEGLETEEISKKIMGILKQ